MSKQSSVSVADVRPDIALLTLEADGDGRVNLDDALLDHIDRAMEKLAARTDLVGVVVRSTGRLAFAEPWIIDDQMARFDWDDEQIVQHSQRGRAVLARFSRCPFPSVALIENDCLGLALELTLWADYRLAVDSSTVGMPGVRLGLTPGWGGASLLPRMMGLEAAADLITSGRQIAADQALETGIVTEVCTGETVLQQAVSLIDRVNVSSAFVQNRKALMGPVPGITPQTWQDIAEPILKTFGERIVSNNDVFPYAPTVALEHLTRTCASPIQIAWKSESVALSQVWGSPANRGLSYYQAALQHNSVQPGLVDLSLTPTPIRTVGIVGAGLMGGSIAKICYAAGLSVRLLDADSELAANAVKRIIEQEKSIGNASVSPAKIQHAADYDQFSDCDLIIESVVETLDVKRIVLKRIESAVSKDAIIATNTSAIPIEKLASGLEHPSRFCGIHFCHPELMALVEVVSGPVTKPETVSAAVGFVQRIEKIPIAMRDSPGFVVNRLLAALLNASLELFSLGVEVQQIDEAMRDFGFAGGPFEIIDVIGVDTCMYAGRTMWEAGVECVSLSPILPKLMKNGRLGRKSGAGFYKYPDKVGTPVWDPAAGDLINGYRSETSSELNGEEIRSRILNSAAAEANLILSEKIVGDRFDIDLCIVNGFSFPKHRGGILFWQAEVAS